MRESHEKKRTPGLVVAGHRILVAKALHVAPWSMEKRERPEGSGA